jgi:hypothetical protein
LHLAVFEQPVKQVFFSDLLGLKKKKPLHWMKELFSGAFLFDHHVSIS